LIVRLISVVPGELEVALAAAAADGLEEPGELAELLHAATSSTAAANPVTLHILRMASLLTALISH
jgi:hypothetical protein